MSTEKPGWVAARAEGGGSVKAVSTRGKSGRGRAKAAIPPLRPPGQGRKEPHTSQSQRCWLPASYLSPPLAHRLSRKFLPARELGVSWGGSFSLDPQGQRGSAVGYSHTANQQQR